MSLFHPELLGNALPYVRQRLVSEIRIINLICHLERALSCNFGVPNERFSLPGAPFAQYDSRYSAKNFGGPTLASGRAIRVQNAIDAYTREALAMEADASFACLGVDRFLNLFEALRIIAAWRRDDNERRPQSSLNCLVSAEFARQANRGKDTHSVRLKSAYGVSRSLAATAAAG